MAEVPEEIADRLYAEPPDRFVASREEAADQARRAGDAAGARLILKLRRPTIAAWLVNLLAIRRPDLIGELAELADVMRAAQRELRGADLRELSTQRRALVAALVAQVRDLAAEADPRTDPGRLPLGEVENTLNAALSDAEVAEVVAGGRLLRAVTYAGFGEIPRPQLRLVTGEGGVEQRAARRARPAGVSAGRRVGQHEPDVDDEDDGPDDEPAEPEIDIVGLRRDLADARTAQKEADADLIRATQAEHDGGRALADLDARIAELERQHAAAEQELSRRKLARKAAERAVAAARRQVGEAQAVVEAAEREINAKG